MSKYTAVVRNKPSLPMQFLAKRGLLKGRVLDYGCGRGFDVSYYKIDGYDPLWEEWNKLPKRKYDTITCNYVLNVVDWFEQDEIIRHIKSLLKKGGKAYFTVRRDIKKNYKGKDCIQRVIFLPLPSLYVKSGQFEIYQFENCPLTK